MALAEVPDGPSVEVGQTQEPLKLLPGGWGGPFGHGLGLARIGQHLTLLDDEPPEGCEGDVEFAFLNFDKKAVLKQAS